MDLIGAERPHFIGIGGAGMSALAKVLLERGADVSGSDLKVSRTARMLEAMGARVHIGHDPAHVEDRDVVIVSSAIAPSNPEVERARELGIVSLTRGEALASVLKDSRSIVVAGTHGKTTTTSMIITALLAAGLDPTYLVGAGLNDIGTNARSGSSDLAVAEADESDGSFLLLSPDVAVITNLEMDHVDHWGSLEGLRKGFGRFMEGVREDGCIVIPSGDPHLERSARATGRRVMTFGADGDVRIDSIEPEGAGVRFRLACSEGVAVVRLRVPGKHNAMNAAAAAAACRAVGTDLGDIVSGLSRYLGVERRFQHRGDLRGTTIIDDYAHHPTEIAATLEAAKPGPWKRIIAVFQPHRYSRTAALAREFGSSFRCADHVILMDVYGAGEEPVPGVSGKLLADEVCSALPGRKVAYLPHRADLVRYIEEVLRPGDALLTLGAGDVSSVGDELLQRHTTG